MHDRPLRHHQVRHPEGIDQNEIRQRYQFENGALHRAQGGLVEVIRVDLDGVGGGTAPRDRIADDLFVEARPLERGHGLRVADAWNVAMWIEGDGRGHNRTGQAAPPDLVDTGDQIESQPPDRIFKRPESADFDHRQVAPSAQTVCFLAASFIRAAFPFSSRRKYSLARRTRAVRTTSILSMIGECSGKIRSTPWPNDTLRTVNVARAPPRCIPITMPSNT